MCSHAIGFDEVSNPAGAGKEFVIHLLAFDEPVVLPVSAPYSNTVSCTAKVKISARKATSKWVTLESFARPSQVTWRRLLLWDEP